MVRLYVPRHVPDYFHRKQEQRQVLSGLPAARIIKSLLQQGAEHKAH